MQSRCCLIFLSALGILVSAQRTTTPPTTTSTQPEGSSPTPSTCAVVVNTCSDDQGCKELLTNFNHRCWRAMHHGHRKQCPQSCADALDALINHTKGAAFATCNCGEDLLCNRRRQYLKRACQLRPGKRECMNSNCPILTSLLPSKAPTTLHTNNTAGKL